MIFDCLDNIEGRLILDDLSHKLNIPLIHGAVERFSGQITVILPNVTKSLLNILKGYVFPTTPQVFPPAVLITASFQVLEAIKILSGNLEDALVNKLLFFDLQDNYFETIRI
ncbi:hypothetical protein XJ44_06380 [Thermosipho affectus]|uniref:THIF-type NAD/FAD binding fold domain-containing protein n=1 Tax=Thermosipho affectus TaxID=660294 RepID=A0ABX3IIB2_9BACT|nr:MULTISPECIES: ThiF family adenylyltransferase [Thermosipho]ONN26917.1 hypothetical protein XJ44_06380 [Thermosipho affectus]